jgi:membrane protein insertase Oxa1/YidC/SpoIIIJ
MVVDTQKNKKKEPSFQESFQESLRVQILYVFPVIILFTASFLPAALGLYWTTSNILGIAQDYYIKSKHLPKTTD